MIEGMPSKEIADLLFVTSGTVAFHLNNVYKKLHVANRVQAARKLQEMWSKK